MSLIYSYEELNKHITRLATPGWDEDYLVTVVNRQKGSKKTHDLYSAVAKRSEIMDKFREIDLLSPLWLNDPEVTPVVYMSNVSIDQGKGYEKLLREEAAKLLQGKDIRQRLLSTNKPAYLGMCRTHTTIDIDLSDVGVEEDVAWEEVRAILKDIRAFGFNCRATKTHGGFHLTYESKAQRMMVNALKDTDIERCIDKVGRDVMSPVPGTVQKGFRVFNVEAL